MANSTLKVGKAAYFLMLLRAMNERLHCKQIDVQLFGRLYRRIGYRGLKCFGGFEKYRKVEEAQEMEFARIERQSRKLPL